MIGVKMGKPTGLRLMERTVPLGDCLIFTGCVEARGYGRVTINRVTRQAHRVAYEQVYGPIPNGLVLDHICRSRACVNPEHLDLVTIGENVMRGNTLAAANKAKTKCIRGHENWRTGSDGRRSCRDCDALRHRLVRQDG